MLLSRSLSSPLSFSRPYTPNTAAAPQVETGARPSRSTHLRGRLALWCVSEAGFPVVVRKRWADAVQASHRMTFLLLAMTKLQSRPIDGNRRSRHAASALTDRDFDPVTPLGEAATPQHGTGKPAKR